MSNQLHILTADVGGTNSRFGRYLVESGGNFVLVKTHSIKTNHYQSFEQLLAAAKAVDDLFGIENVDVAVMAVPGPVIGKNQALLTNLPWNIHCEDTSINNKLMLINDFEAQAFGCMVENPANLLSLIHSVRKASRGFIVVGSGTGLGHCAMRMVNGQPISLASEAGQINFPFQGDEELKYSQFLQVKLNGILPNGDKVLSGQGLAFLHEFLTGEILSPEQVASELDKASVTTRWFTRFLARDCRNYALSLLGLADVLYLSGGVLIKNPCLVDNEFFLPEFINCPSKRSELEKIAVRLVQDEMLGLQGCAQFGFQNLSVR